MLSKTGLPTVEERLDRSRRAANFGDGAWHARRERCHRRSNRVNEDNRRVGKDQAIAVHIDVRIAGRRHQAIR